MLRNAAIAGFWGTLFLGVGGCTVQTPIAESSASTELKDTVGEWCATTCARLADCIGQTCDCVSAPQQVGSAGGAGEAPPPPEDQCSCTSAPPDDCPTLCAEAVNKFVGHGEACAKRGKEMEQCVDGALTCADSGSVSCPSPDDEESLRLCGGEVDVAPTGPNSSGVVHCEVGEGGGTAGGGNNPDASYICEQSYDVCNDGSSYQMSCDGTQAKATCQCLKDGVLGASFNMTPASCPGLAVINAMCQWSLSTLP